MPVRETIIPGTIRYQRCARCGVELGEIRSLDDYDPGALCRDCKAEKAREDEVAHAHERYVRPFFFSVLPFTLTALSSAK